MEAHSCWLIRAGVVLLLAHPYTVHATLLAYSHGIPIPWDIGPASYEEVLLQRSLTVSWPPESCAIPG